MRDFELHEHGRGRHFGGRSVAKPLLIGVVLFVALGLLVMSLWNALLPALLGVKSIGFWQALGMLILCRILFGGLGLRPGMFGARRRMHERWMQMTPEQREQFSRHRHDGFRHRGHHRRRDWPHAHEEQARPERPAEEHAPKAPDAE
ncbi:hypothetical protein [Erwinia oleae]|uniref:hypothetical protein n=1 Tax=Erwinia oleae TaxID=796334 RepID=UPI00054FB18D|nr:hypothetical protein [Erwinia oleae]